MLDLYCGLGNFTLPLARRAAHVVGVEGEAALVSRARDNAALNGIANVEFHSANLAGEDFGRRAVGAAPLHPRAARPTPGGRPRGPAAVGAARASSACVYVSCHPGSLARDLGLLVHEQGFELLAAGIADMFPQTSHVESLAVLAPAGAA